MTKNELKQLSTTTFTDNDTGNIQPAGHRKFNENLIDSMETPQGVKDYLSTYDTSVRNYFIEDNEYWQQGQMVSGNGIYIATNTHIMLKSPIDILDGEKLIIDRISNKYELYFTYHRSDGSFIGTSQTSGLSEVWFNSYPAKVTPLPGTRKIYVMLRKNDESNITPETTIDKRFMIAIGSNTVGWTASPEDITSKAVKTDIDEVRKDIYESMVKLSLTIDAKVDTVDGKQLSTNDYTDIDKKKVTNVAKIAAQVFNNMDVMDSNGLPSVTVLKLAGNPSVVSYNDSKDPNAFDIRYRITHNIGHTRYITSVMTTEASFGLTSYPTLRSPTANTVDVLCNITEDAGNKGSYFANFSFVIDVF